MKGDSLGDRMKEYEGVPRTNLIRRVPVMIRLDGKAFHTFTRGMPRPYYRPFHEAMWAAAKYLCENIQGCQIAYVQSDEITLLLTDYATIDTDAWFDYQVQKMVSVSAGMCTAAFNKALLDAELNKIAMSYEEVLDRVERKTRLATFDARVWNLPKEEVVNAFIWRQQDATRNAIQMAGQSQFSHKELHGVNCNQIQEKLFQERGINFNDYPVPQKRGVCIVKQKYMVNVPCPDEPKAGPSGVLRRCAVLHQAERSHWVVDENIPLFTADRDYIGKLL